MKQLNDYSFGYKDGFDNAMNHVYRIIKKMCNAQMTREDKKVFRQHMSWLKHELAKDAQLIKLNIRRIE